MPEWTVGAVLDEIASVAPDRVMTVSGDRRSTYGETAERTRRLANFLAETGFGAHTERADLANWECGQDRIALIMYNDQYLDMVIGATKARVVPVNVNHHYTPGEVAELLAYLKPRGVIYHRGLGAKFADVLPGVGELLISVEDGSGAPQLPGAVALQDALAAGERDAGIEPSPDDLIMVCTGGTTGRPKAVMWRQGDAYVNSMNGADHDSPAEIHQKMAYQGPPWFAVSPLLHAAGLWTAFAGVLNGLTVVLHDTAKHFDARDVLDTAAREGVGLMTMVGDAYAGPIAEELVRGDYDLSALYAIGTGGAGTNIRNQEALLAQLPAITLINGYGSSETGNVGFGRSQVGARTDTFTFRDGGRVLSEDYSRFLEPGDPEIGWVARTGRIPLGYFDDPGATERTFPSVDGIRLVIAGDRAALEADGTLRLYGRDSLVVNTGGEKVFVEEVEEVLRARPGIADALVVGRDSDRWGQEVVALMALEPGTELDTEGLREHCAQTLARFKVPKEFIVVDAIRRLGNGKADYRWAKQQAMQGNTCQHHDA
ncbi:acyl-CoA synthetase [Mycolicibacterium insubricum]|uniref:Acyl-CoA synthetase n=1 Tax=Mycolicibacterium insubricum TaxID=444597 RepID=A0A1X0DFN2_9MYCO|nr:AMP-binding protein [Mycolicibacterium insubricum]MCB9438833.1 AMP-binding protein [Mycolicibacterium sp.]ORA71203.1 acyl-CoA synthetase [Mycolicibacterium insubricum]BBZ68787.1 acyl-CoA synthetase [Mycolicibacterium insubricum]